MDARARIFRPAAALLLLAASATGRAEAEEPVVLARTMLETLAPQSNEIVGVLIDSFGAEGTPDPANLSDEDWVALADALALLREETRVLRERPIQVVADASEKIFGEETSGLSAADVQAMIEADRESFDYYVDLMLADFDRMSDAIASRDPAALWNVAGVLDVKCNACHERFWYPNWQEDALPPP